MAGSHRFTANDEDHGRRLDQVIAARVEGISRTLAKKILAEGGVFVDRKRVKVAGRLVRSGQQFEVHVGAQTSEKVQIEPIEILIVDRTEDYLVVEKPSGVFSAPTPESDRHDLLAFVRRQLRDQSDADELHLVHRLDRPTSGLMVLARTRASAAKLGDQARQHTMSRHYIALLAGELTNSSTCATPIAGKEARTHFVVQATRQGVSRVAAQLETGRTHQVRLHAEALGTPVSGDSKYGRREQRSLPSRPPRLALHATKLQFVDPKSNKLKSFDSPLPRELEDWWTGLAPSKEHC